MVRRLGRPSIRLEARRARRRRLNRTWASWLAAAILVVGATDAVSTELALATGFAREANPIVRAVQEQLGIWWMLPKMLAHGLLAGGVVWYPNTITLVAMTAVAALVLAVSANNLSIFLAALDAA